MGFDFAAPLDPREHTAVEGLHEALAAVHERWIMEEPAMLEDPRVSGWAGTPEHALHTGAPLASPAAMRVLFLNEGNLGSHVLGQGQLDAALQAGLAGTPDIEARFAGLTPLGRLERAAATRPIPLLADRHLEGTSARCAGTSCRRGARRAVAKRAARLAGGCRSRP